MKLVRISAMWCPACLIMRPIMNEIKNTFPNIEHVEYDYDLDEEEVIPLKEYDVNGNLIKEVFKIVMYKKRLRYLVFFCFTPNTNFFIWTKSFMKFFFQF